MNTLERLRAANPHLAIHEVAGEDFAPYGRVLAAPALESMAGRCLSVTEIPAGGNRYVPHHPALASEQELCWARDVLYGGLPVQAGYCNGGNQLLNALEYHRGSEVDIAATDLVLLLGRQQEMRDFTFDTGLARAFYLPAGTAVELYATTLHFSPCAVWPAGFQSVILLPWDTNQPLEPNRTADAACPEDRLLRAKNKWLLAHPAAAHLVDSGAWPGLLGDNLRVVPCML